jgi:hypothetical protein
VQSGSRSPGTSRSVRARHRAQARLLLFRPARCCACASAARRQDRARGHSHLYRAVRSLLYGFNAARRAHRCRAGRPRRQSLYRP